jgi:hypothetical protein
VLKPCMLLIGTLNLCSAFCKFFCVFFSYEDSKLLLMAHKIVHNNCPPYLLLIEFVSGASSRSTRVHRFKLRILLVVIDAPER